MDEETTVKVDILLNGTVLSNFARTSRLDLLRTAVSVRAATTEAVMREVRQGAALGYFPESPLDWLPVLYLSEQEQATFELLHLRLGAGESACLAVAQHRQMRLATDDADARSYAGRRGVPLSGTLGILAQLTRDGALALDEANTLLSEMIRQGYHAPVVDLSLLIG